MKVSRLRVEWEPHLPPTPQLMVMLDPLSHWARPGIKPGSSRMLIRFLIHWASVETLETVSSSMIKLKWAHVRVGWPLTQRDGCPYKRSNLDVVTGTHTGRCHVKVKAEIRVKCTRNSVSLDARRAACTASPSNSADTLTLAFWPPELGQTISIISAAQVGCDTLLQQLEQISIEDFFVCK